MYSNMINFYGSQLPETYFLPGLQFNNFASQLYNGANTLMGPSLYGNYSSAYGSQSTGTESYPSSMASRMYPFFQMPMLPEQIWMQMMLRQLMQQMQQLFNQYFNNPFELPPDSGKPTRPGDNQFDNVVKTEGKSGDDTQIDLGTPDQDLIIQQGYGGKDTQYAAGSASNDWIEQYGGREADTQNAEGGTGDDYVEQNGGTGDDTQEISDNVGNDTFYQYGGEGKDTMNALTGEGNDFIYQDGGIGNDTIQANAGKGDDTISYTISAGNDTVTLNGGEGTDKVTINTGGQKNFKVVNAQGEVIYQQGKGGSVITVTNAENISILGRNGRPIFQS